MHLKHDIIYATQTKTKHTHTLPLRLCMLNSCLEWDKWVLNERTYPTPDSCLTHLFHGRGRS